MDKQEMKAEIKDHERMVETLNRIAGYHQKQIVAYKKDLAELDAPPVTGRPFCMGVDEPGDGQRVWVMNADGVPNWYDNDRSKTTSGSRLKRGLCYPTEADCIEGEKRREIRARYEAMGRPFIDDQSNWFALWNCEAPKPSISYDWCRHETYGAFTYFNKMEECRAAIDIINRLYGDGAFKRYVLGVEL